MVLVWFCLRLFRIKWWVAVFYWMFTYDMYCIYMWLWMASRGEGAEVFTSLYTEFERNVEEKAELA